MRIPMVSRLFRGRSAPAVEPADRVGAQAAVVKSVIDAVDALVVVASTDCSLWLWNDRCDETSGVPFEEVAGKPLWSIMRLRPNLRSVAQESFDRLISGAERSVEFQAQ